MRFLFGILTGGAITWAASLMLGDYLPSPGPTFRWIGAQFAPEEIAEAIRDAPAVAVANDAPRPDLPAPADEPAPKTDVHKRVDSAPSLEDRELELDDNAAALAQSGEPQPVPPMPAGADTPPAESFDESAIVIAPEPSGWESAWVPFQTKRSALGFAHVLTREVQHPFEVRREASQRYRVTFAYGDEAERERVLAAVRSLTGAKS